MVRGWRECRRWVSTATSPMMVFDRSVKRRQKVVAALASDAGEFDYLRDEVANRLVDRLDDVTKKFDRGLDLGCGSSHVAIALKHRFPDRSRIGHLTQTDVAEEILTRARLRCGENDLPYDDFREVDEETIPFEDDTFDVVTSALSLHWVNDLPGTMVQINRVLKPDGVFMGALFGGDTLSELRISMQLAEEEIWGGVSPHVSPLTRLRDVGSVLGRGGFILTTVDIDDIVVEFRDMYALMRHLKGMGENNAVISRRGYFGKRAFDRANEIYKERFASADGGILATFQVIFMVGWKRSLSGLEMPKTAPRGSGEFSLRDLGRISELVEEPKSNDKDPNRNT